MQLPAGASATRSCWLTGRSRERVTLYTLIGDLPRHHYVWVAPGAISHAKEPLRAVWFGLVSYPGRSWGCNVLLECGAVYRNVPAHALAFTEEAFRAAWAPADAQMWDCYGLGFTALEYAYLRELRCRVLIPDDAGEAAGEYLFTVAPVGDGFSAVPEQAKEFQFIKLANGRLTVQPTDRVLFEEKSFTGKLEWPKHLRRQREVWSAE